MAKVFVMHRPLRYGSLQAKSRTASLGREFFALLGDLRFAQVQACPGVMARGNVRCGCSFTDVFARAEAFECIPVTQQRFDSFIVELSARRLNQNLAIPINSQRLQFVNLTLRGARTHPVDIFNPQNETSVRQACPHPREQRSTEIAQVEVAAGGGSEASGALRVRRVAFPDCDFRGRVRMRRSRVFRSIVCLRCQGRRKCHTPRLTLDAWRHERI